MDACLTQTAPAIEGPKAEPVAIGPHWIRRAIVATIVVGLAWRLVRYFAGFPIWGDEAMVLLNVLERDYVGLTHQLRFAQVAPLFFLWLEKTAILLFGTSEWSVHLFPFLAGLAAFFVFWHTCRTSFSSVVAGIAVCILAVSYYPIRHACEVKPYAFDLLYATIYLGLTLGHVRNPSQSRWLIALVGVTPIAVFSSYPSVFVGGAVSVVLLLSMRGASWTERAWFTVFNVVLLGSFVIHYGVVGQQEIDPDEAARTREFLRTYWKEAFPPDDLVQWPFWLLKTFTGNMLAYPIGAKNGGSIVTFVLVIIGSVSLWRNEKHSLLALCWLPFGLNLIAAIFHKYPFGDSARITLHLAPFICILMAHGVGQALDWIRVPIWRTRVHLFLHLLLVVYGAASIARDVVTPFKTDHDRDVRLLARDIGAQVGPGELVLLGHQRDEEMLPEFLWNLRSQALNLRWQSAGVVHGTPTFWLVQCSNHEPAQAIPLAGWSVVRSEVRLVPPENKVMPPMYCRWTQMVRE